MAKMNPAQIKALEQRKLADAWQREFIQSFSHIAEGTLFNLIRYHSGEIDPDKIVATSLETAKAYMLAKNDALKETMAAFLDKYGEKTEAAE